MKSNRLFKAVLLCLCVAVLFCACGKKQVEDENPGSDSGNATIPEDQIVSAYADNAKKMYAADKLKLSLEYSRQRTVAGEAYTESVSGSLAFSSLGSDSMTASGQLKLKYGPCETAYSEYFTGDSAYSQLNGLTFKSPMSAEKYAQRYLPMGLPAVDNYGQISHEKDGSQIILTFEEPKGLESWVAADESVTVKSIAASVTLDDRYYPASSIYKATYQYGAVVYDISVSFVFSEEEGSSLPELDDSSAISLEYFDAPKYLLQAAGDIFTSASISSEVSQVVSSSIHNLINTQQRSFQIWGTGKELSASANYTVTNTDYRGSSRTETQADHFENGVFTRVTNNGTPIESQETPDHIRIRWEDKILNGLFALNYLSGARVTETKDFYLLEFDGNEAFCNSISSSLVTILPNDLDSIASSHKTTKATGYLSISRQTGLPTAMGMNFERSHVIDNVSYPLSYQMDQTLMLSSTEAHSKIYGTLEAEAMPGSPATPLFYHVTGPSGEQMWLLGTIHAGDERTAHLPKDIYNALSGSDSLAVEFDINEFLNSAEDNPDLQEQLVSVFYYLDGSETASHLSKEVYNAALPVIKAVGGNNINTGFMRPVMWSSIIESYYIDHSYSLSTNKGVDQRLVALAKELGKPVLNIESGLSQLKMMAGFSDKLQEKILLQMLDSGLDAYVKSAQEMYELWCQGNEDVLRQAVKTDTSKFAEDGKALYQEYYNAMISSRNSNMISAAKGYLSSGKTVFFAVGLTHLLADDGIIAGLSNAGYTVTPVLYN